MNKDNINTVAHRIIKEHATKEWIALDATAGNGNDTYFLCSLVKQVIAFDIQEAAKNNTLKRCSSFSNLEFHLTSHIHINTLVKQPLDCVVFNFGYLPNSTDRSIITLADTSLEAVKQSYSLLKVQGIMTLSCYIAHDHGNEEHQVIHNWIKSEPTLCYTPYQQKENAPILYMITKIKHTF